MLGDEEKHQRFPMLGQLKYSSIYAGRSHKTLLRGEHARVDLRAVEEEQPFRVQAESGSAAVDAAESFARRGAVHLRRVLNALRQLPQKILPEEVNASTRQG